MAEGWIHLGRCDICDCTPTLTLTEGSEYPSISHPPRYYIYIYIHHADILRSTPHKGLDQVITILPSRTSDLDYWWKLTGSHLAKILHATDYSDNEQVDALLFHYHYIVSLNSFLKIVPCS
jgi:hypothetical protein